MKGTKHMRMVGRLALLWIAAVLAMILVITIGLLWDSLSQPWLREARHFWERVGVVPVFEVSTVAALLSAMLPNACFGMAVLEKLEQGQQVTAATRGSHELFEAFFITSFLVLPLLAVFPLDEQLLRAAHPMTRGQYIWTFFGVWFALGALNVWAVLRRRQRLEGI
jgi:ABC-type uncharacterized transport system permease subunit